jgi:hypothetical protein
MGFLQDLTGPTHKACAEKTLDGLTLVYEPFPAALTHALPPGVSFEDVNLHCVCDKHMPKLWKHLGKHHRLSKAQCVSVSEGNEACTRFSQKKFHKLQGSCSLSEILVLVLTRFSDLRARNLTTEEQKALQTFYHAYKKLKRVVEKDFLNLKMPDKTYLKDLPELRDLAEPLNTLFFNGILGEVDYDWQTHREDGKSLLDCGYYAYCSGGER